MSSLVFVLILSSINLAASGDPNEPQEWDSTTQEMWEGNDTLIDTVPAGCRPPLRILDIWIPPKHCCPAISKCATLYNGDCQPWYQSSWRCDYKYFGYCQHHRFCVCCVDCEKGDNNSVCGKLGGACRKKCYTYEYENLMQQCHKKGCKCCKKCRPSPRCKKNNADWTARCVSHRCFCSKFSYISKDPCYGDGCLCCKRCRITKRCKHAGGYCIRAGECCAPGYSPKRCGCTSRRCSCCVPDKKAVAGFCSPIIVDSFSSG
ncbi:uncharacterized protein LOC121859614 [Homarus americanus]|uniref:uncharacterized protein LOC121859614 n=1 Tax=Homarus americanus TaxID=6706 RepID=UPI001C48DA8F|nr:uncharacterized protein LOC121859614 [Homarus americanus]